FNYIQPYFHAFHSLKPNTTFTTDSEYPSCADIHLSRQQVLNLKRGNKFKRSDLNLKIRQGFKFKDRT
ncbi:MAG: hypothetical protein ACRC0N_00880, partial [Acinetobacter johnsonii]